jgi:hypothetical protein
MSQYSLTLLTSCQQIRAEANALLYGSNHFEFLIVHGESERFPYNTIRALPQFAVRQIKACTIHICIFPRITKQRLNAIRRKMGEICKLLMQDGNLQELIIDARFQANNFGATTSGDPVKFEPLLQSLKRLRGLKLAIIKVLGVAETYGAELKRILEDDGIEKYKRKAETDSDQEVHIQADEAKRKHDINTTSHT